MALRFEVVTAHTGGTVYTDMAHTKPLHKFVSMTDAQKWIDDQQNPPNYRAREIPAPKSKRGWFV